MMVLNEICKKCNYICNAKHFQQNFENWTSGNNDVNKFIQVTQLSEHTSWINALEWASQSNVKNALEWIPYNRFYDIKYIVEGKLGKIYRANWIDGNISYWSDYNQNWKRENPNIFVIFKSLNNLTNITSELHKVL